jgi:hypothetical protein
MFDLGGFRLLPWQGRGYWCRRGHRAGTVGAVLTGDRDISLPAETKLSFSLSEPVSIKAGS